MIGRVAVAIFVIVIATLTYPGALMTSLATRMSAPRASTSGPAGALPWLHVEHPSGQRPYIADEQKRLVILHGATPAGLIEFGPGTRPVYPVNPAAYEGGGCPANLDATVIRYPPICEADIKSMASLGFNLVRLPISWSELEPERGQVDAIFLDRVAQIVDWARAASMYVLLDMHQNGFSHFVGPGPGVNPLQLSGAPRWATMTDGMPSQVFGGNREINPAVFEATNNFWYDRDGIQDEYIAAFAQVVRRFKDDSVVAGFGIYNEPWIGWNLPPGFDDLLLFPFYRRVIDAVTGARDGLPCWSGFYMPAVCGYRDLGVGDRRHLMLVDTGLIREVTDFPSHLGLPVSSYPNVVLGLHAYTHTYTPDRLFLNQTPPNASYPWGGYDQGWDAAEKEAKAMDVALFLEEFGTDPAFDDLVLKSQLAEAERHRVGYAFWVWKENKQATQKPSEVWGVFDPPPTTSESSGCIRPSRERQLGSVYPRESADPQARFHYDSLTGAFTLEASGRAGDPPTVVYISRENEGAVSTGGSATASVLADPDGSRLVSVSAEGGAFTVSVAPHELALTACA